MKKIINLLILGICFITFLSCSKNKEGEWDDNIHLSKKQIEFNSSENLATITTGTSSWWLSGIELNGNQINLQQIERTSQNFIVENPEFKVKRINGNIIKIEVNANSTNIERTLIIRLQNGDYFDGIKVIQKAN